MSGADRPTVPPVRLPAEAELAREAASAPLFSRAVLLARWAASGIAVGAGGELLSGQLAAAATELGLGAEEEGRSLAGEAWNFAVDSGLVEIEENGAEPGADMSAEEGAAVGTAMPGGELEQLTAGGPADVLDIWVAGLEAVLADASTPSFEDLLAGLGGAVAEDGRIDPAAIDPDSIDLSSLDWDQDEEADFLDAALGNLYLLAVTDETVAAGAMVPLPVVAAAMVVPDDMEEPTDEALEEVSTVMMKLDEQFRVLATTGLLDHDPVDEELIVEEGETAEPLPVDEEEDLTRYGQVRLTPLGLYAVRRRMVEAGLDAPLVGDLAALDAEALLAALPGHPAATARAEAEQWLGRRPGAEAAARELLAAARGDDAGGPGRRLGCQVVLSLIDRSAEPVLREVLSDRELGGLARVWLAERGAGDVPPPPEDMVFWLTIDTLAAQLAAFADDNDPAELRELVSGLVDQHSGFFDKAWQTDHPATADVLEAMGRLHPDDRLAKEARKAALKSRSMG